MSDRARTWAAAQKTGKSSLKHTLEALADLSGPDGIVRGLTQDEIAERLELSVRQVRNRMRALEVRGWIVRHRSSRKSGRHPDQIILPAIALHNGVAP